MQSARNNKGSNRGKKVADKGSLNESIRLNRFIANAGICSRREADELIKSGKITVNGQVVKEMGMQVRRDDNVKFEGKSLKSEKTVYILLNKPKNYITTLSDEKDRKTVMELIRSAGSERVVPVGRLDKNTTGLLLFTNDGELTAKLTHPSSEVKKLYHVIVNKAISESDIKKIAQGFELEDGLIKADDVSRIQHGSKNEIGLLLHSGRNRIVRRMMEHLGYSVEKLDRVMFANLTKKDLPRGKWRRLDENEIGLLKRIVGK